ncbi:MAG: hypothetical protein K0S47_1444 [Herbinix sp.]|jgi:hypothetical protein|nr:hypothetical protein [Herbinix sp.]
MSDLSASSYCNNKCDNGLSSMLPILLLLLSGGDNGIFSGCNGNKTCGNNSGIDSILPLLLILSLGGGCF